MNASPFETGTPPPIVLRHRLRIAREHADLNQDQLADVIGVSRNTISNAESGKVRPRRITINAVALATGVPASWLLEGDAEADQSLGGPGTPDGSPPNPQKHAAKISRRQTHTQGKRGRVHGWIAYADVRAAQRAQTAV